MKPELVTDYDYQLTILGDPKAQGRPRATVKSRWPVVYEDKKDRKAKQDLAVIVQQNAPEKLLECPLRVGLVFHFVRPKGHFGTGRNEGVVKPKFLNGYHTAKPDVDNLAKLALDALTGIFWRDDACVCDCTITKRYSDRPRTEIYIKALE